MIYEKLIAINDSPFVRLNRAMPIYSGDVLTALHQLKKLGEGAFMQQHYLFHMRWGGSTMHRGKTKANDHTESLSLSPTMLKNIHQKLVKRFHNLNKLNPYAKISRRICCNANFIT